MFGFVFHGNENKNACLILLFTPWVLDSAWAFGLAVTGVFFLAVCSTPRSRFT
jgi:hypothetical protein